LETREEVDIIIRAVELEIKECKKQNVPKRAKLLRAFIERILNETPDYYSSSV